MSKKDQESKKLTATERVANSTNTWLQKNAKWLVIGCGVLVAIVIALVIIFTVLDKSAYKRFDQVVALDSQVTEYKLLADAEKSAARSEIISEADAIVKKVGLSKYEGAKAAMIKADMEYDAGSFEEAASLYADVAKKQSKTYLSQVALVNQAACLESLNRLDDALAVYDGLWTKYGKDGIYGSRALFNVARLNQELGNTAIAKATYEQLMGEYSTSSSEYAKLAAAIVNTL